jgi:hypothetical protein
MLGRGAGDEDKRGDQEWFQRWNSQGTGRTKRADETKEEAETQTGGKEGDEQTTSEVCISRVTVGKRTMRQNRVQPDSRQQ